MQHIPVRSSDIKIMLWLSMLCCFRLPDRWICYCPFRY